MGRANFGVKMMRKKGILGKCLLDGRLHFNWVVYPLPMDNLHKIKFEASDKNEMTQFYKGYFCVKKCADTFLRLDNFRKGFVVINGFNIGKYWEIGPQKSLYVPASLLREGKNEIIIFDSEGRKGPCQAEFVDFPTLG